MDKRIAVIGAGAIGGYTGGHLAHNGFDVTLIDPWPEHVEAIRKDGLAIEGVTAEEYVCARPKTMHLTEVQQLAKQKPIDIAMVSVKSYDTEWATTLIGQYLAPDGYVVSLQNCMNEERIAGIVGRDKTVGVIPALLGAELYAPGRVRRTGPRRLAPRGLPRRRGAWPHHQAARRTGGHDPHDRQLKATTNLWGERWSKLCVNGMANGVAAATGLSGNDMNRDDKIRRLSIRLPARACASVRRSAINSNISACTSPKPSRAPARRPGRARRGRIGHPRGTELEHPQRVRAAVDGAGHAEGPAHRDRFHQWRDRREGAGSWLPCPDPRQADRGRQAGRARQDPGESENLYGI